MRAAACAECAPLGVTCRGMEMLSGLPGAGAGAGRSSEEEEAGGGGAKVARRHLETGRLVESTQAEDRRMIALVAARPLLYARSTLPVASYYTQVKQLWQEVAELMGWTVAEVRRKWSHIRNSYSRHLRNEIHGMRTGRGRMVSRWYLADDLEFLRQHMATDTRQSSQYSVVSPFAPSLLKMEVRNSAPEEDVKPRRAWYSAPEPAPSFDDSCGSFGFEPDENAAYFHFFRGIYKDYQELTPKKQRFFRRQCLILLHGLVDGPQGDGESGEGTGAGAGAEAQEGEEEDTAINLSCTGYTSDTEREHKVFVQENYLDQSVSDIGADDDAS